MACVSLCRLLPSARGLCSRRKCRSEATVRAYHRYPPHGRSAAFRGSAKSARSGGPDRKAEEEATKQASRTLTEHGFVGTVELVGKVAEAQSPLVLTGTVRLPVSLPVNVYGFDAYERRGQFATSTVIVKRRDGTVLATGESRLTWKACWWETGRGHHNLPVDDVLADFVRKATDQATRKAFQQASAKTAHG